MDETEAEGEVWRVSFLHPSIRALPRVACGESHSLCARHGATWDYSCETEQDERVSSQKVSTRLRTVALSMRQGLTTVSQTVPQAGSSPLPGQQGTDKKKPRQSLQDDVIFCRVSGPLSAWVKAEPSSCHLTTLFPLYLIHLPGYWGLWNNTPATWATVTAVSSQTLPLGSAETLSYRARGSRALLPKLAGACGKARMKHPRPLLVAAGSAFLQCKLLVSFEPLLLLLAGETPPNCVTIGDGAETLSLHQNIAICSFFLAYSSFLHPNPAL